jgi:multidrug efflux pump subunit AcrB
MRPGELPEAAVGALSPAIKEINASLPKGYQIVVGGTVKESTKSQSSVVAVIPLMLFLMIQLQSFNLLALVLSVVPMGLIGIIVALLLVGKPLGFVAILGTLALLGLIARNAVILIEQMQTERA